MRLKIVDECYPPSVTCFGVTQSIELKRDAVGNAELLQQLISKAQKLDIGLGLGGADHLRV